MTLRHLPVASGEGRLTEYRIDQTHGNAFALWKSMGSPTAPNGGQYAQLVKAGQLWRAGVGQGRKCGREIHAAPTGVYLFVLEM
jgi:hypothetical protein